jgi:tetratricopeptide (TPR) repeat protein
MHVIHKNSRQIFDNILANISLKIHTLDFIIMGLQHRMLSISQQAQQLFADGQTSPAVDLLKQNASDVSAQILLREYYLGEQFVAEALKIIETFPECGDAEDLVNQSIQAFYQNDYSLAEDLAEQALIQDAHSFTAYNHLGRALQNQGQSGKAIKAFKSAVRINPKYAEGWHNFGHTRRALGVMDEAKTYYQKAIEYHQGYQSAWLNLALTESVLEQFTAAVSSFESLLKINPQHVLGWLNLGLTQHVLGQIDQAIDCYDRAMDIDPDCALAYSYKGIILNELQDTETAIKCLQHAIELDPNEIDAWCELTNVYEKTNNLQLAQAANQAAQAIDPYHPTVLIDGAKLLFRSKDFNNALTRLRSVNPHALPVRKQIDYWFELGLVLEKLKQFDEAFQAFEKGNQLATTSPKYQAVEFDAYWQRLSALSESAKNQPSKGWFKSLFDKKPPTNRNLGHDLYFLMGFPRSGTTLIDTILNSHQSLITIEEKPTLERVIEQISQENSQLDINQCSEIQLDEWRQIYWQAIAEYTQADKSSKIIDKLPLRFIQSQLITKLLPQAKSIFMLRHPCDVILSNFMQNYMPNQAFVHFNGLAETVEMYTKSMALWLQLKPLFKSRLLEVKYEHLVGSAEQEVPKICDFLGVDFQSAMLQTSQRLKAKSRISTNSYAQVAQDIHVESVFRWEHYRAYFEPHLDQIEPFIKAFGYNQ